ncbi:MAG: hypothetical protein ACUZ8O_02360 [Candidatus Anammoxibacter sp.]
MYDSGVKTGYLAETETSNEEPYSGVSIYKDGGLLIIGASASDDVSYSVFRKHETHLKAFTMLATGVGIKGIILRCM